MGSFRNKTRWLTRYCLPWKNTPLRSCPTTEYRFLAGLGGSETNANPAWFEDHWIVAPV